MTINMDMIRGAWAATVLWLLANALYHRSEEHVIWAVTVLILGGWLLVLAAD